MSTISSIIFQTVPDSEQYYDTVEALKDLEREYSRFSRTVWKASRQLLKFDEINRLVAQEVEEEADSVSAGRKSSGSSGRSSSSSSKSSSKSKKEEPEPEPETVRRGPASHSASSATFTRKTPDLSQDFAVRLNPTKFDFDWSGINWEEIMAALIAGLSSLSGGILGAAIGGAVGGVAGGPLGMFAGIGLGLLFGIHADEFAFNWDGKLDPEEIDRALRAILPAILGGVVGLVTFGPAGAAVGLTIGTLISLDVMHFDYTDIIHSIQGFFSDLTGTYDTEWNSWSDLIHGLWNGLKEWWSGLVLDRFTFRLPHVTVEWEELGTNSILARVLGIPALPHLGVEWYARGGIVSSATLIGAGEAGKEAIVPLERHTEWIHLVAEQLASELEKLSPAPAGLLRAIPDSAPVPYGALVQPAAEAPDFSDLAQTIASAIAQLGEREAPEPEIRVYLDGRQLSDAVTRYQRRASRAFGA